jgi:hypothetical protein
MLRIYNKRIPPEVQESLMFVGKIKSMSKFDARKKRINCIKKY